VLDERREVRGRVTRQQLLSWLIRTGRALAAVFPLAWLYARWLTLPITESRSLAEAYVEGAIGAVVCGLLLAFVVRHVVDATVVSSVAVLVGHAWVLQHATDIALSFWSALETTVPELRRYHIVLVGLILTGWGIAMLKRRYLGAGRSGAKQA
jgi:hypothetical protein